MMYLTERLEKSFHTLAVILIQGLLLVGLTTALPGNATAAPSKDEKRVQEALNKGLSQVRPELKAAAVEKSQAVGLYEVVLSNGDTLYTTKDGEHIITGKVLRLEKNRFVDVREEKLQPLRKQALADVPLDKTISFPPDDKETLAVVHVFTDVDCGYCQKMHSHMAEYNALGIEVRYLAYPRAGPQSISAKKLVNAWCAQDKQDAMNKLKSRQRVPEAECANPVAEQYDLGQQLGINGTPAVINEQGVSIGGYLTPEKMAQALDI